MQSVSEPINRILTQVGIGVASKSHHTLSSLFRKPKDVINFEQKHGLVYQISCRDCNAVYIGETGRMQKEPENGNMLMRLRLLILKSQR